MRESFSEYKKTLDQNLIGVKYLYDGDINFSTDESYSDVKLNPLTSPSIIIKCISKIYEESFNILKFKSREVIMSEESLKLIVHGIFTSWDGLSSDQIMKNISKELGCNAKYIFFSEKTCKRFEILHPIQTGSFPPYFNKVKRYKDTDILWSPFVEDIDDEIIIYAVDKSFQSLVYSIQNMDYLVEMLNGDDIVNNKPYHEIEWRHTINYKLYDCNFQSLKIRIKNVSKMRHDKINEILSE